VFINHVTNGSQNDSQFADPSIINILMRAMCVPAWVFAYACVKFFPLYVIQELVSSSPSGMTSVSFDVGFITQC
jgi:hypothetical protein